MIMIWSIHLYTDATHVGNAFRLGLYELSQLTVNLYHVNNTLDEIWTGERQKSVCFGNYINKYWRLNLAMFGFGRIENGNSTAKKSNLGEWKALRNPMIWQNIIRTKIVYQIQHTHIFREIQLTFTYLL